MSILSQLTVKARSSLLHYVDMYTRQELGHLEVAYTSNEVRKILARVLSFYGRLEYSKDYIGEIKDALSTDGFVEELENHIEKFLDNRPAKDRMDYYIQLCTSNGHTPKANINKDKMEKRIRKLIKTNGESQDI